MAISIDRGGKERGKGKRKLLCRQRMYNVVFGFPILPSPFVSYVV